MKKNTYSFIAAAFFILSLLYPLLPGGSEDANLICSTIFLCSAGLLAGIVKDK